MGFAGLGYDLWALVLGFGAGFACGFLNTAASSGSAVSLPVLMMIGLDPVSANGTNRIPVLIGALSATWSFHQKKALLWALALKVSLPVAIGGLIGAGIAEILPGRDLALVITAAVLVALVLLFTKLKHAIEQATAKDVQYGAREFAVFVAIGVWLGFIVLDGATYMLLALTLVVGLPLVNANAIKSAALVPTPSWRWPYSPIRATSTGPSVRSWLSEASPAACLAHVLPPRRPRASGCSACW
ncbi:MAG TPA: sulfite exporter TauE/SafE family protein [Hyphomicrobiaceae bacterium]|nr:sulfite exporter TauE/SafE family protein [Hyphomicrobiaceae bacterium]